MRFLDIIFTVFHTCLVFFNLFGWIWRKTRRLNLICLLLTGASWVILGIFYGFGYCPLTRLQIDQSLVDAFTMWGLIIAMMISLYLNFRHWFKPVGSKECTVMY